MREFTRNQRFALAAAAATALIYSTLGVMRGVLEGLRRVFGPAYPLGMNAALVLAGAVFIWYCRRAFTSWRRWVWAAGLALAYAWAARSLSILDERFHLVEYGFLSWMVTEALRGRFTSRAAWHLVSFLIVSQIGAIDEILQGITPGRVGDVRDVLTNTVSAALAQTALFALGPPSNDKIAQESPRR